MTGMDSQTGHFQQGAVEAQLTSMIEFMRRYIMMKIPKKQLFILIPIILVGGQALILQDQELHKALMEQKFRGTANFLMQQILLMFFGALYILHILQLI